MLLLQCVPLLGQTRATGGSNLTIARLPITFEQNQGQADFPTQFLARAGGVNLEMRPAEIAFVLGAARKSATLKLDLLDGDRTAHIIPLERMESESDYFLGRDPSGWHTHVPNFRSVRYEDIYPGIDLLFYGNGEHLEHDFRLAPFADYRQIRMRVRGARAISLQPGGSLKIALANGNLIFQSPNVYQESKYGRVGRHGRFILLARNEVGFEIGDYDRSKPLVIDPVLDCETFLASTPFQTFGVATDVSGNTYVSGMVGSSSAGAVLKVNSSGTGLVYAAYFGDSVQPYGGIAVDANGDAVVAAASLSTNVPLVNPVPFGFPGNGSWYAYIFSLSPDGSSINYASLLGGGANPGQSSNTYIGGVALDRGGNAYVSGDTDSPVFPVTAGALNNNNVLPAYPNRIIYATKFLPNGKLGYSALIGNASPQNGGGGLIGVSGIAADSLGSAYIAGTAGTLWPITATAYQKQIPGTAPYAAPFVTKLSADGSTLVYSTFLGSEAEPTAIIVNGNGEAFVAGENAPRAFPTTGNAFQSTMTAGALIASFVSELSADGSQLPYSTFVQGQGQAGAQARTSVSSISFDLTGNLWLAGTTNEFDFPMVHPLQSVPPTNGLTLPGFLGRLDSSLASLTFSTFVGDLSQGAQSLSVALDANGRVHLAGVNGYEMYTSPSAYIVSVPAPPPSVDYLYGFSAVIDPNVKAPATCLPYASIRGLSFGNVAAGSTETQGLVITNCGELPLQISGEQSSDPAYSFPTASGTLVVGFRELRGRTTAIAWAALFCLLLATFGTRMGWRYASAFALAFSLFASLGCGAGAGSQSAVYPTAGAPSCLQAVPVNGSCTLSVTFTPKAARQYPAVLTVSSNASMPLFLPLSGTGTQ